MKVLVVGHVYELDHVGDVIDPAALGKVNIPNNPPEATTIIRFVGKEPGREWDGVTTQELVRMLIDRTIYCNNCLPHWVNEQIVWHFRQIIALHEGRAIMRKAEKGEIRIEDIAVGPDGHFRLDNQSMHMGHDPLRSRVLDPVVPISEKLGPSYKG